MSGIKQYRTESLNEQHEAMRDEFVPMATPNKHHYNWTWQEIAQDIIIVILWAVFFFVMLVGMGAILTSNMPW